MRFKIGQKVRIVKSYSGSSFNNGEIVEIIGFEHDVYYGQNYYTVVSCENKSKNWLVFCEDEIAPITNADRIRAMSNDELADFLSKIDSLEAICNSCPHNNEDYCLLDMNMDKCVAGFKNWLAKEC